MGKNSIKTMASDFEYSIQQPSRRGRSPLRPALFNA